LNRLERLQCQFKERWWIPSVRRAKVGIFSVILGFVGVIVKDKYDVYFFVVITVIRGWLYSFLIKCYSLVSL
jgi:hypothetical protein